MTTVDKTTVAPTQMTPAQVIVPLKRHKPDLDDSPVKGILINLKTNFGHILRQKGKITPALHHSRMDKQIVPMQNKRPVF